MPDFPCWADIAARDYAADPIEDRQTACCQLEDQISETWSMDAFRDKLKPHEVETLDGIISSVAARMIEKLEQDARDDFNEPDWD